jgi:hypothetical protein
MTRLWKKLKKTLLFSVIGGALGYGVFYAYISFGST